MFIKKIILPIILFTFSINLNAQFRELEKNPNWNKYKKVIEKKFPENNKSWSYEYNLKGEKINSLKSFFVDELRSESIFSYDDNSNLKQLKMISDSSEQIVDYDLKYNKSGQLIAQNNIHFDYDKNGKLIRKYLNVFEDKNSKSGWSEKYIYNDLGHLIQLEKTTYLNKQLQIDIENYIYDDCKNIIQISRKSNPNRAYPIVIIGGENKNEVDVFEYEYNIDCIWYKKYKLIEGEKKLISERELGKF